MTEAADHRGTSMKCKAISTIFHFAISLEQDGQQAMFDAVVHALRHASSWKSVMWDRSQPHTDALFEESSSPSLNRVIVLTSPYRDWSSRKEGESEVARWATAVLAVPYTEEVGQSVVDAALQIAFCDSLRSHIPIDIWALFKERPSLPPTCRGRSEGTNRDIIQHVRGLGDLEILKSYFLLVWSEWEYRSSDEIDLMGIPIWEDFGGTGMGQHREDLLRRLDHVMGELDRGLEYFKQRTVAYGSEIRIQVAREQYGKLKDVLLELERDAAMTTLTRTSPKPNVFRGFADSHGRCIQGTTRLVPFPFPVRDFAFEAVEVPSRCSSALTCLIVSSPDTFLLFIRLQCRLDTRYPSILGEK